MDTTTITLNGKDVQVTLTPAARAAQALAPVDIMTLAGGTWLTPRLRRDIDVSDPLEEAVDAIG